MDSERWRRARELFEGALAREPEQWPGWLDRGCAGDEELRREVEALLTAHGEAGDFLDGPLLGAAPSSAPSVSAQGPAPTGGEPASGDAIVGRRLIDRYTITGSLGKGGMGVVYRAHDPRLDREVAIKMIAPSELTGELEQRFRREAQLVAGLDHPAIVPIHDVGVHEQALFFVMPLVEGSTLRHWIRSERLRLGEALSIVAQVADALDYSHRRGVVHRDIKPANIMVSRDREVDGGPRARVMDFGIAHTQAAATRLTQTGGIVGTLTYVSPEQITRDEVDGRSDLYALGTVLYECLVGTPPFTGSVHALIYRILHEQPLAPRACGVDIDASLEQLLLACLAKEPAKRPQRGSLLAEQLRHHRAEAVRRGDGDAKRLGKTRRPRAQIEGPPLVGRAKEVAGFERAIEQTLAGECQLVLVGGGAGVGKTRLLREAEVLAAARGMKVLNGRFSGHDRTFPFQGLCELIQDGLRGRRAEDVDRSMREALGPELLALFPSLVEVTALAGIEARPRPPADDPTELFELLARALRVVAAGRPTAFLLENLHLADVSIDALQYIVHRLGPTPTLIAGTFRSEDVEPDHPLERLRDRFRDDPRLHPLQVDALEVSAFRDLLVHGLGSTRLREDLVTRLFEATEGNPLFVLELLGVLREDGGVRRDESGSWSLARIPDRLVDAMPLSIQQAVERRLARLDVVLRRVLSIASVLGRRFELGDVRALIGDEDVDLDAVVDQLVARGDLLEDQRARGDGLLFASGPMRDIVYAELPRRLRRRLHRRHAERLEQAPARRRERLLPQLVHHFAEGDVAEKTVDYARRLAIRALAALSPEDAIRAAKVGLSFCDQDDSASAAALEGELRTLIAKSLRAMGELSRARREAERAAEALSRGTDRGAAARTVCLVAELAWQAREVETVRWWVDRGTAMAREAGETDALGRLLTLGATVANLRGAYRQARAYLDEAEGLDAADDMPPDATPGAADADGGTLVSALPHPVRELAPDRLLGDESIEVAATIYETLLGCDDAGAPAPSLAEAWHWDDDETTLVVTLRQDICFSDGTPLDAGAVKRSFERAGRHAVTPPLALEVLRGFGAYRGRRVGGLDAIEIQSKRRLAFHLSAPLPLFPVLLTAPGMAVSHDRGDGPPLGSGPFRLARLERGEVVLERNPADWRRRPARLESVVFRHVPEAFEIASGLRAGTLDIGRDLLPEDLDALLAEPRLRSGLVEATRKNLYFVLFRTLGDDAVPPAIRRAMTEVVSIRDLVWRTLGRFAQPAMGLVPPGMLGHDAGRRRRALSPEVVRERLERFGVRLPVRLRAAIHPLLQDRYGALTSALVERWQAIGVELLFELSSLDDFHRAVRRPQRFDLVLGRWQAAYDDPDDVTYGLFHSRHGRFRHLVAGPEIDRLLERARRSARPSERARLYATFTSLLDERHALLPLFHDVDYRLATPAVSGLRLGSSPPYVDYRRLAKVAAPAPRGPEQTRLVEVALAVPIETLDPAAGGFVEAQEAVSTVFETLTRLDDGARVVPWLAASVEPSAGWRSVHVRLREDVRFHDGRRLTARDVRHAFERVLKSRARDHHHLLLPVSGARELRAGRAGSLAGLRVRSTFELTFELDRPAPFFPAALANPALAVVPEGERRFTRSWRDGCVGSGPFRVVRFAAGKRLDLEANPDYWRAGRPRCQRLVFHLGMPAELAESELRGGRLSMAGDLGRRAIESLHADPHWRRGYQEAPRLSTCFLVLNARRGPLASLDVRRVLRRVLDLDTLLPDVGGRWISRAYGLIPPGLPGHGGRPPAPAEPAREARLQGLCLRVAVHPVVARVHGELWAALCGRLTRHGIEIEVRDARSSAFDRDDGTPDADLSLQRWIASYPDPDSLISGLLHQDDGALAAWCRVPSLDVLIERARGEADPALRDATYREIEELLTRQALVIPLFYEQGYRFCQPGLHGLRLGLTVPHIRYEDLHVA